MRKAICLFWIPTVLSAQPLTLFFGDAPLPVESVQLELNGRQETVWKTEIGGRVHFVLAQSILDSLLKKIEQQQAVEAYYQQIQRHTERLLQKYQRFSEAAQRHVALQQQLVDTTTALYEGYQSMYHDLKRIMGMSNLAVIMTLGVVDASGAGWQPVGGIGVALRTWQASYRFGRRYRGVEVGLRWPLGF